MIKVVEPSVELWKQDGYDLDSIFKHIAKCTRVAYQSTPKNKDENAYDFLVRTIFKGHDFLGYNKINVNNRFERILAQNAYGDVDLTSLHLSCCEHATVHLKFPTFIPKAVDRCVNVYSHNKYSRSKNHNGYIYVTTNLRVIIENYAVDTLDFVDATPNCPYYIPRPTVCFITDIGASRELNRHRVNSVSEESTRYCVSGDTKLKFKNPHLHYTIKEFYDNFVNLQRSQLEYLNEDTGELLFGPANKVFYNGKKEVYNVVTKLGYSLKCTADHKIYTPNGYVELKDLSVGDKVYVNGTETTVLYRDKSWLENQYITLGKTVKEIDNEFGYSKYVIDKWLRRFQIARPDSDNTESYKNKDWLYEQNITLNKTFVQIAKETGYNVSTLKKWAKVHNLPQKGTGYFNVGHKPWNKGLSEKDDERVKRQGEALRNFHYDKSKKGISILKENTTNYQKHNTNVCEICGSTDDVEVHHIDKNHNNNNPENLISLCSSCHTRVHNQSLLVIYADEIVSITKIGIEDVYDIEMPNYHNYVANGIVVHNCAYDKGKFGNGITVAKLPWIPEVDPNDEGHDYTEGFFNDNEVFDDNTIEEQYTDNWTAVDWFLYGLQICDLVYRKTRELGWAAQQAREILPLNTKTQVVHTAFDDDWNHYIDLRSNGISGAPHPMAKELADKVDDLINATTCG